MKIGIFDPYLDDLGGGEKYMMTIASCLSLQNDVSIFWDRREDIEAIEKRFSLALSRITLVPNIFTSKTSVVQRIMRTRKFDVIIFLTDGSIPLVSSRKLFLHIQQPLASMQVNSLLGKIKLARVNGFFCNSRYTKSYIEKKFSITPQVIYPPVNLFEDEHAAKGIPKKENIILHVGRFRSVDGKDYKKQSIMIAAFKAMIDHGLKGWKFVIASSVLEKDMDAFTAMQKTAKGYPIEFYINQSNTALWESYAKAKIYWHASGFGEDLEKNPELAEHFGISTVEAMSAGAVPVVIAAGGQKEIVQDGENGLLWETLSQLESQTIRLTKDIYLLERLSKSAKESAKKFSTARFCQEIYHLL